MVEPLSRTKYSHTFVIVMVDRYTSLEKAVPTSKATDTTTVCDLLDHWVSIFSVRSKVLTVNALKFVSIISSDVCSTYRVKIFTTFTYRSQLNARRNTLALPLLLISITTCPSVKQARTFTWYYYHTFMMYRYKGSQKCLVLVLHLRELSLILQQSYQNAPTLRLIPISPSKYTRAWT